MRTPDPKEMTVWDGGGQMDCPRCHLLQRPLWLHGLQLSDSWLHHFDGWAFVLMKVSVWEALTRALGLAFSFGEGGGTLLCISHRHISHMPPHSVNVEDDNIFGEWGKCYCTSDRLAWVRFTWLAGV